MRMQMLDAASRKDDRTMATGSNFTQLFRKTTVAFLIGLGLVLICYAFIDRPLAFYVRHHNFDGYVFLKWLTYPPPIAQAWTPVVLVALLLRRLYGPLRKWELALIGASVSMVLADQFRQSLAYVFGRYWPETWINGNPSLIGNGAYGFHWFHGGIAYASFPSGHTARTLAVASVMWMTYPRWRWVCVFSVLLISVGLVGMNYHFVGDVVAGGFVGGIVGAYTACG